VYRRKNSSLNQFQQHHQ